MNEVHLGALMGVIKTAQFFKMDRPCQIVEGLYLGSASAANNKVELKKLNVTHVLTVADNLPPEYPDDFKYKVISVPDIPGTDLRQHFDECFDFINESKELGGCTLVHCYAGISRSVTIVVAYLMKAYQMSFSQALEDVRSKRTIVAPNYGFIRQLRDFEKSLQVADEKIV